MEKRIEVLKNIYKLDIKRYESITHDLLMIYKNIQGIYFIYSDITEELYIGKSKNIGQRIDQHRSNTNFVVKDLLKKNPYLYIIKLNRLNTEQLDKLEAFLIYDTLLASKGTELKLLNIEYNPSNLFYEQSKLENKINEKYNPEVIYNHYKFYIDFGIVASTDIVKFIQVSNTPLGIEIYRNLEYLYKKRKIKEEEEKQIQYENKIKLMEKIKKQVKDLEYQIENQLDELFIEKSKKLEIEFKNKKYELEKEITIIKTHGEKSIQEVKISSIEKTIQLLEKKIKLLENMNKVAQLKIEEIEREIMNIDENIQKNIVIIKDKVQEQIIKIKNNLIQSEELFRQSEINTFNYKKCVIAEIYEEIDKLCLKFLNTCYEEWNNNSNLGLFSLNMIKGYTIDNTIKKYSAEVISNKGNLYAIWKSDKRRVILINIIQNNFYLGTCLREIIENKLNYKIKKMEHIYVEGLEFKFTLEAANPLENKFYAKYEDINIAKINYNEYIELIGNEEQEQELEQNRIIEEIDDEFIESDDEHIDIDSLEFEDDADFEELNYDDFDFDV